MTMLIIIYTFMLLICEPLCHGYISDGKWRKGQPKFNVLFLVADDMRPQLGCYGGPDFPSPVHPKMHTPNLDALAAKSLLLKNAYVQQAVCSPSRTSLLTGRRPDTTHVYDLRTYFRESGGNFTTLPQYFKQNGYVTAGMGKIFQPGVASGEDDPISWSLPYYRAPNVPYWASRKHSWLAVSKEARKERPLPDAQIADKAVETLKYLAPKARTGEQPFFLGIGIHKPHLPFVFPEEYLDLYPVEVIHLPANPYAPDKMPSVAWFNYIHGDMGTYLDIRKLHSHGAINSTLPDALVKDLRRAYYASISFVDDLFGMVLNELEKLGLSNNTIVSFWGDHGYQLGEHAEWTKQTNFEIATRAPMMIHIPQLTDKGISTEELTEFVDLFPTLVEAAGLPEMPLCPENSSQIRLCREGTSLMPLIKNHFTNSSILYQWKQKAFSQFPRPTIGQRNIMGYSMRTKQYRYTEWVKFDKVAYKPDWNQLYGIELYDHSKDSEENYNAANDTEYLSLRSELSKELRKGWRDALPHLIT